MMSAYWPNVFLAVLLAYLLGSVSGSLVIGRIRKVDIRTSGSGNAGGTNALRTQGFAFALGVVIIDIGKGVVGALLPEILDWPGEAGNNAALYCAVAAIVGHCFPVWHGFRGGKGAATTVGALAVIQPLALIPMLTVWFLALIATGWVGLATMLAGIALVPALFWLDAPLEQLIFGIVVALFLIFTHRSNIKSMLAGNEHRFERVRLVNWFRRG